MSRRKITDLREERAGLAERLRTIINDAESEDRDLTGEEQQDYDRTELAFDSATSRIKRMETEEGLSPILNRDVSPPEPNETRERPVVRPRMNGMDAMAEFFRAQGDLSALSPEARQTLGVEARAAYAVGAQSTGGYTVAQDWSDTLIEVLTQYGVIESLADQMITSHTGQVHLAVAVEPGTAVVGSILEAGAYVETEDTFGEVLLNAYKYGGLVKASDEMLQDSHYDINGFIQHRASRAISLKTNNRFAVGTGTGEPNGVMNNTAGVTLASGQTLTISSADSLIDLYHSLTVPYRANAVFMMHDQTLKIVRKLKDTTNQYLWQPGLQAGVPDLLLGKPVYIDPDIAVPAASAKTIYFGDVKQNYMVRSVNPVTIKVLTELYAGNGQVGFRIDRRVDGQIQDTAAARVLVQSAT